MAEEIPPKEISKTAWNRPRPVFLTVLCLFSFAYFGIMACLFLLGFFYSGAITSAIVRYTPGEIHTKTGISLILAGGFLFHILGLIGLVLLWKQRKPGYYMLALVCLLMAIFQTLLPAVSAGATAFYIVILLMFGVFFKRYR